MEYTLEAISEHSEDPLDFVQWLSEERFINIGRVCPDCEVKTYIGESSRFRREGVAIRCPECKSYTSVRRNSFFQPSPLSLKIQMQMLVMFAADSTVSSTARLLHLSRQTVTNFFDNCRGAWQDNLHSHPIEFEIGQYEVDECLIKRVKDPQHDTFLNVWVGGIYERSTGRIELHRLANRTIESMIPPLRRLIPDGSIIFTDEHKSYNRLDNYSYGHFSVNHSAGEYQRFEDICPGWRLNVHINTMEGINSLIRRRLSSRARRDINRLDLILAEIAYRLSDRSLFAPFKWF